MNRSFIRWAAFAATSAALALTSAGALAQATITLSDSNCVDFTLSGPAGAKVLTCVQSTTPLCTISGPTAGTLGNPITLNDTCVPAATSYAWTGGNCNGITTKSCNDSGANYTNGQVVAYTVTGANGQGPGPAGSWSVTWTNTPPQAPSGCSVTGLPSGNQTSPYSYALGVSCSGGGAPTAWQWSGGSTATTQSINGSITSTTTFSVVASNAGGPAPAASGTISVGGGGGGGGGITCAGYAATKVLDLNWATGGPGAQISAISSGFGGTDALILRFTTPSGTSPDDLGHVNAGESGAQGIVYGKLSATACDFTSTGGAFDITQYFTVGSNSFGAGQLQPNTTYYYNMHHDSSCTGTCDVIVILQKPQKL